MKNQKYQVLKLKVKKLRAEVDQKDETDGSRICGNGLI